MKPDLIAPPLPMGVTDKILIGHHITLAIEEFGIFYITNVKKMLNGVVIIDKNAFRMKIVVPL